MQCQVNIPLDGIRKEPLKNQWANLFLDNLLWHEETHFGEPGCLPPTGVPIDLQNWVIRVLGKIPEGSTTRSPQTHLATNAFMNCIWGI